MNNSLISSGGTFKIKTVLLISITGIMLLSSYFIFPDVLYNIDTAVFFFFNRKLVQDSLLLQIVAYTNMRAFDVVAALFIGGMYYCYYRKMDNSAKWIMIGYGLSMLFLAVVIKQLGSLIPISHKSPTLYFENVNRITMLTDIPTKDSSNNSFPGDHGMVLMIFAAYMARYFGRRSFIIAFIIAVVFTLPRIASGAHWFSDVYVGSLSIICIVLSWVLLTPVSEKISGFFQKFIPKKLFPTK